MRVTQFLLALTAFVVFAARAVHSPRSARTWTQHGFADFAAGDFGRSLGNLYVSASGRLQMVYRWDLNDDGVIDLVFANSHDISWKLPVSIYENESGRLAQRPMKLLVRGGRKVRLA